VVNRKVGNQVFYSVRDRLILEVLDIMRRYFYAHLSEGQAMLDEIKNEIKDEMNDEIKVEVVSSD
jgi:ArsR family transcriptional regulator